MQIVNFNFDLVSFYRKALHDFLNDFECILDRTTAIGQMINGYLSNKQDIEDHAVHLLFSANRWELVYVL